MTAAPPTTRLWRATCDDEHDRQYRFLKLSDYTCYVPDAVPVKDISQASHLLSPSCEMFISYCEDSADDGNNYPGIHVFVFQETGGDRKLA